MRIRFAASTALTAFLFLTTLAAPAVALDETGQREFRALLRLSPDALARKADEALQRKYPGENWDTYGFPRYVYTEEPTKMAYRVAVKEPETLAVATCGCFCDEMGHKTLAYCFLKEGSLTAGFDDHAVGCNICVRQALLAFLWAEMGATPAEIQKAMKNEFGGP